MAHVYDAVPEAVARSLVVHGDVNASIQYGVVRGSNYGRIGAHQHNPLGCVKHDDIDHFTNVRLTRLDFNDNTSAMGPGSSSSNQGANTGMNVDDDGGCFGTSNFGGLSNAGMSNTGMSNTGMSNTGMSITGMSNTGMSNTGMSNAGMSNTSGCGGMVPVHINMARTDGPRLTLDQQGNVFSPSDSNNTSLRPTLRVSSGSLTNDIWSHIFRFITLQHCPFKLLQHPNFKGYESLQAEHVKMFGFLAPTPSAYTLTHSVLDNEEYFVNCCKDKVCVFLCVVCEIQIICISLYFKPNFKHNHSHTLPVSLLIGAS